MFTCWVRESKCSVKFMFDAGNHRYRVCLLTIFSLYNFLWILSILKVATFLPVLILRVLSDMISFKLEELCYVVQNWEYDHQRDVAPAFTHTALQCQCGSLWGPQHSPSFFGKVCKCWNIALLPQPPRCKHYQWEKSRIRKIINISSSDTFITFSHGDLAQKNWHNELKRRGMQKKVSVFYRT